MGLLTEYSVSFFILMQYIWLSNHLSMKESEPTDIFTEDLAGELPEKAIEKAISITDARLAAHQTLVNNIESKAMNFLALIITVAIALFAAAAVIFSGNEPRVLETVLIIAAIVISLASAIILILRVVTHQSWYLPGQNPDDYLSEKKRKWASSCEDYEKALNYLYLRDQDYYVKYNLERINRQVKAYRFAVSLYTLSIASLGLIYTVISVFLQV